jgi:hypothetical protein
MRQPRPEDFDPKYKPKKLEEIDLSGVVPIKRDNVFSKRHALKDNSQDVSLPNESQNRTVEPNERTERSNRTTESNARTEQSNGIQEQDSGSLPSGFTVRDELDNGIAESQLRKTQRYSFEIYIDQLQGIEDLQYHYKKRTGKRLSASRIIREALDFYLKNTL